LRIVSEALGARREVAADWPGEFGTTYRSTAWFITGIARDNLNRTT
jgi:hypothetical protein